ncbi:MAG: DUF229 domain-containing protein [Verrucomicrobia bacterium]|nr:MAG: DUF229 domain-containing protein [Verrucomicrobiota bacterium]
MRVMSTRWFGWLAAMAMALGGTTPARAGDRPNILWITVEDMSPDLGCYGDAYARTPNLDRFAREAVRYTRAFATAPVCSPARSCLITGLYATSLGTQRLRSAFPIPDWIHGFPSHLRQAGYYTANNVKTDYNTSAEPRLIRESWDACSPQADWRGRREGQPFFCVINLMTTHQSRTSVWSFEQFEREIGSQLRPEERHDPNRAPLPPFYPDTALARRTWARYHDCITLMDRQVGEILARLEQDGLAEDTIVFFFSDHGMGMPRGKRVLHDTGLRVPLLIRFPGKWSHLAPAAPGGALDRLVSFVDFPPTVLSLAGLEPPAVMQGRAFLGPHAGPPRRWVHGARDRVDEVYDVARSVRDGRWLYIRNFMPHLPWMQWERYSDQSDFRREFLRLAAEGRLTAAQMTYARAPRPIEELYDTANDPWQIRNLAGRPEHADRLAAMRAELRRWMRETRDLGLLPEAEVGELTAGTTPFEWARRQKLFPGEELLATAEAVGRPVEAAKWRGRLASPDPAVRYWAVMALAASPRPTAEIRSLLRDALRDEAASVRIVAAGAAWRAGLAEEARAVLARELEGHRPETVLLAARTLELLGEPTRPLRPAMDRVRRFAAAHENEHPCWMFVRFALEEALERLAAAAN